MPYITKFSSMIIPYNEGNKVFSIFKSIYSNSIKAILIHTFFDLKNV